MPTYFNELLANGVPKELPASDFLFEDLFDEYVASTQKVWRHDRSKSIGASEAFGCARKSFFSKRGKDYGFIKDADHSESWGAMRRGDLVENFHVVPAMETGLRRRGMDIIMHGEDQETIVDGVSSATSDGLIINAPSDILSAYGVDDIGSNCVTFEIKSFDPRINIFEEKGIHRGQTQMQMGLIRDTTEWKPNYAVICYVNASWLDDIRIFVVPFEPETYAVGRARAEAIYATDDPARLAAEGKLAGMCAYCPYTQACAKVSTDRIPPARKTLTKKEVDAQDTTLVTELNDLVREERRLNSEKKKIEASLAVAKEAVAQKLIEKNESRAVGSDWKVSYTKVAGRKTLSKELIEEAGLNPDHFMVEGGGYEKLTITSQYD